MQGTGSVCSGRDGIGVSICRLHVVALFLGWLTYLQNSPTCLVSFQQWNGTIIDSNSIHFFTETLYCWLFSQSVLALELFHLTSECGQDPIGIDRPVISPLWYRMVAGIRNAHCGGYLACAGLIVSCLHDVMYLGLKQEVWMGHNLLRDRSVAQRHLISALYKVNPDHTGSSALCNLGVLYSNHKCNLFISFQQILDR